MTMTPEQIEALRADNERLKAELAAEKEWVVSVNKDNGTLLSQNDQLRDALAETHAAFEAARKERDQLRAELKQERDLRIGESERMRAVNAALRAELEARPKLKKWPAC